MATSFEQNVVCPSCGKRYRLSDFKSDKLICSACGREIPRFVSVGNVSDETKYVKQYLDRQFNSEERLTPFIIIPFMEVLGFWLCTLHIALGWKAFIVLVMIFTPGMIIKEFRYHWKVRRIFSSNYFRLREGSIAFQAWYRTLSDDDLDNVPLCYKGDFLENLYNYVQSHAEINQSYERTSDTQTKVPPPLNGQTVPQPVPIPSPLPIQNNGQAVPAPVPIPVPIPSNVQAVPAPPPMPGQDYPAPVPIPVPIPSNIQAIPVPPPMPGQTVIVPLPAQNNGQSVIVTIPLPIQNNVQPIPAPPPMPGQPIPAPVPIPVPIPSNIQAIPAPPPMPGQGVPAPIPVPYTGQAAMAPQPVMAQGSFQSAQQGLFHATTEFDYPPERCPACGKLYNVGDFGTNIVQCRYCGNRIKIRCQISEEEMKSLCGSFMKKILQEKRSIIITFSVLIAILSFIIYKQIGAVGGIMPYIKSWHFLTGIFLETFFFVMPKTIQEYKKIKRLFNSPHFDFLSIELQIKKDADKGRSVSAEENALAAFKKSLFELYRKKGKVIGRY